ncbi:ABC transporter permease [Actinokineospora sp. HUAS TT18]|uniref:ABC transporter permease n=1 Tax=Actinokineospora sp. HUAS TT18 TaxID=3447451 RepID=UPI003F51EC5E
MTASTHVRFRDTLGQAISGLLQRPGRAALTALGTTLGIGTFVAVLGLSASATGQISARFTALSATEVTLERDATTPDEPAAFPSNAQDAVANLPGVVHVGVTWPVPTTAAIAARPDTNAITGESLSVQAITPGYLDAIHASYSAGMPLDRFHHDRGERVAILGSSAAHRLGVSRLDAQPAIFIGSRAFTVIGIVDHVDRAPDTLLSVMLPSTTVEEIWGPSPNSGNTSTMLIETQVGAAPQVSRQAKTAARPDSIDLTRAVPPADPRALRDRVAGDLDALGLALAGVVLLVGTIGIANTTLVAVLERVPEIGLRRALGARRRHIASQFVVEAGTLGLLGGLIGTAVGIGTVVIAAMAHSWTPLLDPRWIYPSPLLGALAGLLAGLYPSWKAGRIEPADALRV